jgi:HK97 family phage portal protein
MGLVGRMLAGPVADPRLARDVDPWSGAHWGVGGGVPTVAGVTVSAESVQTLSAVWAAVGIMSSDVAGLGCYLYRRMPGGGRERADEHPLYELLAWQPNPFQTAFEFWELVVAHVLLRGNFYGRIYWDARTGQVAAIVPLVPDRMTVARLESGRLRYTYRREDGSPDVLSQLDVFHVRGRSDDGITGLSLVKYGARSFGLGIAQDEFAARFFSQGATPSVVVSHPATLGADALENLRQSVSAFSTGLRNAHGVLALEEGAKAEALGISPEDAQLVETRKFSIEDVARWTRIPVHKLAAGEKAAAYASVEANNTDYVVSSLRGWLVRMEQAIRRDLIVDQANYYAKFNAAALLRGDTAARGEFYRKMFEVGAFSTNQILELEELNGIGADGDRRFVPANLVPIDQAGRPEPVVQAPPAPRPPGLPARARGVVEEACARVVRKETAALSKGAARHAANAAAWEACVREFYADHVTFVASSLRLPMAAARGWCEGQASRVLADGVAELESWEWTAAPRLVALVLDDAVGG